MTLSKIGLLTGYIFKAKQKFKQQNQAHNQDFAERDGGLNYKLEYFCSKNVSYGWRAEQTGATQDISQTGGGGGLGRRVVGGFLC